MNFQSVMDSPERVRRVMPPSTTRLATQAEQPPSHQARALRVPASRPSAMPPPAAACKHVARREVRVGCSSAVQEPDCDLRGADGGSQGLLGIAGKGGEGAVLVCACVRPQRLQLRECPSCRTGAHLSACKLWLLPGPSESSLQPAPLQYCSE